MSDEISLKHVLDTLDAWIDQQPAVQRIAFTYKHDDGGRVTVTYDRVASASADSFSGSDSKERR